MSSERHDDIVDSFLEAAIALMTTNPPSAITGRQLAETAGLNYGLLHRHLGSKNRALALGLDRIIASFLAEAFEADTDLPFPNPLRTHETYWRASTYVLLDEATFRDVHTQSPVVARYRHGMARARPELDGREVDVLVTVSAALHFGLSPLYRPGMAAWLDLDAEDPRIDELLVSWIDGLHRGSGPLGSLPAEPRRLRPLDRIEPLKVLSSAPAEERLVNAGAVLLSDRAPSAISGRALATEAGVNYGLIHHYFGSKDEVLRQSLIRHRRRFFAATNRDGRGADYFDLSSFPGFVRAVTWTAIDSAAATADAAPGSMAMGTTTTAPATADDERPALEYLLQRVTQRQGALPKDQRIGLLASISAQMAWVLLRPSVEQELGYPVAELAPQAAALLHRLTTEPEAEPTR